MIRSNPLFNNVSTSYDSISENQATYSGITLKTLLLLGVSGIAAFIAGIGLHQIENLSAFILMLLVFSIVGFIAVIIGRTNPSRSAVCGAIYSVCEGTILGTITALVDMYMEGIALIAIGTTAIVFLVCLVMFSCGMMRSRSMLSRILAVLFISIILSYVMLLVCSILEIGGVNVLYKERLGLTLLVEVLFLVYATVMLFLNFNEATYYVQSGATKDFEWTAAFGFLVSILYIYLEVLRIALYLSEISKN